MDLMRKNSGWIWAGRNVLSFVGALFAGLWVEQASASAILTVTHDQYYLEDYMIWGVGDGFSTSSQPAVGTVVEQTATGAVLSGSGIYVDISAQSNNGWAHSNVLSIVGANYTTVYLGSNLDDDCPFCMPFNGFSLASWDLAFDVQGAGATLDLMGWMPNSTYVINEVSLTDLTLGTVIEFPGSWQPTNLLDGHSYQLSAITQQHGYGLDDLTALGIDFNNATFVVAVPEPAIWTLMLAGAFAFCGSKRRKHPHRLCEN